MQKPNILLVYKRSSYSYYLLKRNKAGQHFREGLPQSSRVYFKQMHDAHAQTLNEVRQTLRFLGLRFREAIRGRKISYNPFNLIITVGGDGTFLEAAKNIKDKVILGVNSDPSRSIGNFCGAGRLNFKNVLKRYLLGQTKPIKLHRLSVKIQGQKTRYHVLNDVLLCDANPAAMSRYELTISGKTEIHRGSGIWISPAAGSSGAIHSAGGKKLSLLSSLVQYQPRELHRRFPDEYKLKGGVLSIKKPLVLKSLMHYGAVYLDGAHQKIPVHFGDRIHISNSSFPLRVIYR